MSKSHTINGEKMSQAEGRVCAKSHEVGDSLVWFFGMEADLWSSSSETKGKVAYNTLKKARQDSVAGSGRAYLKV